MNCLKQSNRSFLVLLLFIFQLGWLKFYAEGQVLYVVDYGLRIMILTLFFWKQSGSVFSEGRTSIKMIISGLVVFTVCVLFSDYVDSQPWKSSLDGAFFNPVRFPVISDTALLMFDLTIGLILVGFSEEAVYRVLFFHTAQEQGWGNLKLYLSSIFWFSVLHLPQGLSNVMVAAVFGIFLMWFYLKTRSFVFVSVAHVLINMWFFGSEYRVILLD